MTRTLHTTIGDLIALFYEQFVELYGDEELASIATAAVIDDLLAREASAAELLEEAA